MKRIICSLLILILVFSCCSAFAATMGEKNALQSAKDYLNYTHFSYEGLMKQLDYEGYSKSECQYAVDNCGADWFDQAAGCAKDYLEYTSFSRSGLINQLLYEGFTQEQAEYGTAAAYGDNPTKPGSSKGALTVTIPTTSLIPGKGETSETPAEEPAEKEEPAETVTIDQNYDVSGLSYDELKALEESIIREMTSRPEYKTVLVPPGVYEVGVEIPAGKWTITATEGYCDVYWGKALDEYKVEIASGQRIDKLDDWGKKTSVTWELTEGTYIVVRSNAVTFAPYIPASLGF